MQLEIDRRRAQAASFDPLVPYYTQLPTVRFGAVLSIPQAQLAAFEIEQPLLVLEAAPVASQFPVAADDAVARDDDRDRIGAVRQPDRAARRRVPEAARQFAIRNGLAVWDEAQLAPDALLKIGARRPERQIKAFESAGEERAQLPHRFAEVAVVLLPGGRHARRGTAGGESDLPESRLIGHEQQLPGRTVHPLITSGHLLLPAKDGARRRRARGANARLFVPVHAWCGSRLPAGGPGRRRETRPGHP